MLFFEDLKNIINKKIDFEKNLELKKLIEIPEKNDRKNNETLKNELISYEGEKTEVTKAFEKLIINMQFLSVNKKGKKIFLITSSFDSEGKTYVSANMGISFAKIGKKVVIIDADLNSGRLGELFEIPNNLGLSNYLSDLDSNGVEINEFLNEFINETDIKNLNLITSGTVPPNSLELLSSKKFDLLIKDLSIFYDVIIIDGTSMMTSKEALLLTKKANSIIIVADARKTSIKNVVKTKTLIEEQNGTVMGIILNKSKNKNLFQIDNKESLKQKINKSINKFRDYIRKKLNDRNQKLLTDGSNRKNIEYFRETKKNKNQTKKHYGNLKTNFNFFKKNKLEQENEEKIIFNKDNEIQETKNERNEIKELESNNEKNEIQKNNSEKINSKIIKEKNKKQKIKKESLETKTSIFEDFKYKIKFKKLKNKKEKDKNKLEKNEQKIKEATRNKRIFNLRIKKAKRFFKKNTKKINSFFKSNIDRVKLYLAKVKENINSKKKSKIENENKNDIKNKIDFKQMQEFIVNQENQTEDQTENEEENKNENGSKEDINTKKTNEEKKSNKKNKKNKKKTDTSDKIYEDAENIRDVDNTVLIIVDAKRGYCRIFSKYYFAEEPIINKEKSNKSYYSISSIKEKNKELISKYNITKQQAGRVDPLIYNTLLKYDRIVWKKSKKVSRKAEEYVNCMIMEYNLLLNEKRSEYIVRSQRLRKLKLEKKQLEIEYKLDDLLISNKVPIIEKIILNKYSKLYEIDYKLKNDYEIQKSKENTDFYNNIIKATDNHLEFSDNEKKLKNDKKSNKINNGKEKKSKKLDKKSDNNQNANNQIINKENSNENKTGRIIEYEVVLDEDDSKSKKGFKKQKHKKEKTTIDKKEDYKIDDTGEKESYENKNAEEEKFKNNDIEKEDYEADNEEKIKRINQIREKIKLQKKMERRRKKRKKRKKIEGEEDFLEDSIYPKTKSNKDLF